MNLNYSIPSARYTVVASADSIFQIRHQLFQPPILVIQLPERQGLRHLLLAFGPDIQVTLRSQAGGSTEEWVILQSSNMREGQAFSGPMTGEGPGATLAISFLALLT